MESLNQNQLAVVSEIMISYQPKIKASLRPKVSSSKDAYQILKNNWNSDLIEYIEEFKMILLNRANKVLGIVAISRGGVAGTVCDPKVVFAAALKANASSIIIAHNHPSGNLKPSEADRCLTKKLRDGGALLEIAVPDHLILTSEGYYSFADEGLMY